VKRPVFLLSLLLVASLAITACATATPEPEPTSAPVEPDVEESMLPDLGGRVISIAMENAYLPFNFILLSTGEADGWDYDFLEEACDRLNCVPDYQEFGWDTMIAAVADGQFDMAADGITITDERAESVDFSDGYVATEQRLLVRIDDDRFDSLEALAADPDAILSQQIGTTNYAVAVSHVDDSRIIEFDGFTEAIQAVVSGDTDGSVVDDTAGQGYLGANKDQLKLVGESLSSDNLGFIFPLGSDLVDPFNQVIAEMKADGFMAEINTKWFGPDFITTYDDIEFPEYPPAGFVGTDINPIKVLFVPSVDASEIIAGGDLLSAALTDATGLVFEVSVPTSYAATIEEMCASPDNTMGFIPGLGYVLANQLCGVDVSAKADRFGYPWYAAMFVVQRDSAFETIEDLEGATWATPEFTSTSGYLYPTYLFQDSGITPGETVESGGHTGAMRAVYNGEVDFATAFYSPYRLDGTAIDWLPGEDPEVPADLIASCANTEDDGTIMCGNVEVRDARRNLRREVPDAVQMLRIVGTTSQITNDTVSFGPDFPPELRDAIMAALFAFVENDKEGFEAALDAYSWNAVLPAVDADYDDIRLAVQAAGFTLEDLGQ
jgi:phosphate/phosphite/phosphonate ABC transporter binding protein